MAELTLKNIKKTYAGKVDVIHGIDLQINSGEFCVFVGPSGCGKSTLLRMISGLESITEGECLIDGNVVNHIPAAQRGLAMVFQSYALYPHMSVRKNLSFGLENLNMPKAEIAERVAGAAKMLQIEPLMDRRPGQLSGGQRQRVAIGRAVVREPKIFLFDEPLSNLDAELRVSMRREISALHERLGNTMIYVTHDQVEAMTLADKIVVLRGGVIEQVGTPLELYNNPCNRFVAGFIGSPSMNFLQAEVIKGHLVIPALGGKQVPAPVAVQDRTSVILGIRPHHVQINAAESVVQLDYREALGNVAYDHLSTPTGEAIVVESNAPDPIPDHTSVNVNIDLANMLLFDAKTETRLL